MDDLAFESDDDDAFGTDLDDGGHVLVGLVRGDGDAFVEQLFAPVRPDEPDDFCVASDFDATLGW